MSGCLDFGTGLRQTPRFRISCVRLIRWGRGAREGTHLVNGGMDMEACHVDWQLCTMLGHVSFRTDEHEVRYFDGRKVYREGVPAVEEVPDVSMHASSLVSAA